MTLPPSTHTRTKTIKSSPAYCNHFKPVYVRHVIVIDTHRPFVYISYLKRNYPMNLYFQVVGIGNANVGKTCLIKHFCESKVREF